MKVLAAFISIIIVVMLLAACGKGNPASKPSGDQQNVQRDAAPPSFVDGFPPPGGRGGVSPPSDVDVGVFEMLRDEFLKALGEFPERTSASAPMGESGRVTDLAYDPGTGMLTWTYVNLGDYNLSGDVSIADVAEVARYYLADATDGEGDDPFEAWVDGSGDGEVNIADVAPLAQNYLNEVAEYVVLTSAISDAGFFEIGRISFSDAKTQSMITPPTGAATSTSPEIKKSIVEAGLSNPALTWRTGQSALQFRDGDKTPSQTGTNFPKIFAVALPPGALNYIAVQPVDSLDNAGERSNAVVVPGEGPPVIVDVQPTHVERDIPVVISAVITGAPVTAYFWDFGGGATPNISSEPSPTVMAGERGVYQASLVVTNVWGSDTLAFALTIGGWHVETLDSEGDVGHEASIAVDSSDNLHIGYSGKYDLMYTYFDGTSWQIETVDSEGTVGLHTSIAIDSSDNAHISYLDATNADLKYAYYDGASWQIETVDSGDIVGLYISIALDSSDNPYISYYDQTNKDLKYAYYDGASWQIETVDSGDIVGLYISIALDSSDNPYISYYDQTNKDLKYAYYQ